MRQVMTGLFLATAPGLLWGATPPAPDGALPLWEMRLGGFARYGPSYPASEENQFNFVPAPFPVYRGKVLRLGDDNEEPIKGRIFRNERAQLEIDFGINFSSDSDDIDARAGMPDLDLVAEIGPELELVLARGFYGGNAILGLQGRAAFSFDGLDPDYRGIILDPELSWVRPLGDDGAEIKLRAGTAFATEDYMDYFYEVPAAFQAPGRPAYDADAGYLGSSVAMTLNRPINEDLELWFGARLHLHDGAANDDSPLFTDDTTASFFLAFMWKFWESERRAKDAPLIEPPPRP